MVLEFCQKKKVGQDVRKNNMVYCINRETNNQSVGGRKLFELEYNRSIYKIDIISTEGEDIDDNRFEIYFLSIDEPNTRKRCIYIKIDRDSDEAIIIDLNNYFPCIIPAIENKGRVVLLAMIEYCRQNKDHLGIRTLMLDDTSEYKCPDTRIGINLIKSRQFQGIKPYYMEYGFKPIKSTANWKIENNIKEMTKLLMNGEEFVEWLKSEIGYVPIMILNIIKQNNMKAFTEVLKIISQKYCDYYAKFYTQLFIEMRLKELVHDETSFELML